MDVSEAAESGEQKESENLKETGRKSRYNCTVCGKLFLTASYCNIHEEKMHNNAGRQECTFCDQSYTNITSLNYHLIVNHKKEVKCNQRFCHKTFDNFEEYLHHKKETCWYRVTKGRFFNENSEFRNVKREQGSSKNTCKLCGKQILSKNMARHFELVHHQFSKPLDRKREHDCPTCQRSFQSKGNLTRHIKESHENKIMFACSKCNKQFIKKFNMMCHQKKCAQNDGKTT